MIEMQVFLYTLMVVSTTTSLVTEAIKKLFNEFDVTYRANVLTGVVAVTISFAFGVAQVLVGKAQFTAAYVVSLVTFMLASWLCAMLGYDKVVQTISQFKMEKKG